MHPDPPVTTYRGRFAPSPTGPLHPGSLVAALGSWLMARHARGEWWVRIEDLDPPREVPRAAEAQLRALDALGLRSDGPVVRQSGRQGLYRRALEQLLDQGDAFTCHCSRADVARQGGVHRGCAGGPRRPDPAIRLRVPAGTIVDFDDAIHGPMTQDVSAAVGDFVLRRTDGLWAYQLAVVVDDADQGITDVVRGADLLDSTPRQIHLQRRLGLPTPRHAHLPLVLDGDGRKLSKTLRALPIDPDDPLPALRAAWAVLGQRADALPGPAGDGDRVAATLAGALAAFDPSRIPRASASDVAATHNEAVTRDI